MKYNRKMTDTMKKKACKMREDGYTLQEIADKLNVSETTISFYVPKGQHNQARNRIDYYKYPNINNWLVENKLPLYKLAKMLDVNVSTVLSYFTGATEFKKPTIDKLLEVTGLTYEEAFAEKLDNGNYIETLLTHFERDQERMNAHYKQMLRITKENHSTIEELQNQVNKLSTLIDVLRGMQNDG